MLLIDNNYFYYQNTVNNLSFTLGAVIPLQSREKFGKKKISKGLIPKPEDNYQVYNSKSINGWITNKIYYINGQRCDAFGRTAVDVGFEGLKKELSYPSPSNNINFKIKKSKRYNEVGGIDSDLNLNIKKSNNNYFYTLNKLKKINRLEFLNSRNNSVNTISDLDIHQDLSKYLINHFNFFQNTIRSEINLKKKKIIKDTPVLLNHTIPYNFISPPSKFKIDNIVPKKF